MKGWDEAWASGKTEDRNPVEDKLIVKSGRQVWRERGENCRDVQLCHLHSFSADLLTRCITIEYKMR